MTEFQNELLLVAGSQVGIKEATGHNDGDDVQDYLNSVGLQGNFSWCQAFVYWCGQNAALNCGVRNPITRTGLVRSAYDSADGTKIAFPVVGAQFFMETSDGHHTGLVTGTWCCGIHTIEGNEANQVLRRMRSHQGIFGYKIY